MSKKEALIELNKHVVIGLQKLVEHTDNLLRLASSGQDITQGVVRLEEFTEVLKQVIEKRNKLARETDPYKN